MFGVFVLKEPLLRGNAIALICGMAGIAWIVQSEWSGKYYAGNALALLSGVTYAGVIVIFICCSYCTSYW